MAARKTTTPQAEPEQTPDEPTPDPTPEAPEQPEEEHREPTAVEAAYIDALRREREGYLRYGRTERAEAVADELRRHRAPLERAVTAPPETA